MHVPYQFPEMTTINSLKAHTPDTFLRQAWLVVPAQPKFTCFSVTELSLRWTPLEGGQLELVPRVFGLERVHYMVFKTNL